MKRIWEWFQQKAKTKHAQVWLVLVSFAEASFFPLIADMLLIPMLAARTGRWKYYAFITTVASVLGALFGYALGLYVFEPIVQPLISFYHLTDQFAHVGELYSQSTFWSVLTAAITPIPFKVFVLAGGFFSVPLVPFVIASIIGRAFRYYIVAWLADKFGPEVADRCIEHFNYIFIVVFIFIIIALSVYFDLPELIF